jgi:hypothetical protein
MVLQNHYWFFHLLLYTSSALCYWNNKSTSLFIQEGPWEIALLKPSQLFGLDYLNPIPHAVFWSLLFNVMSYAAISVSFGNYRERNYAEMFVDIDKYITNHENAFVERNSIHIRYSKSVNVFLVKQGPNVQLF